MTQQQSIQVSLQGYTVDDGMRPWRYARPRTPSDPHSADVGGTKQSMLVTIRNGRSQGLRLDQHSFQLVTNEPTAMRTEDFYRNDEKKIKSQYYEEIKQSIVKYTGATAVVILQHRVRHGSKQGVNRVMQPYAHGIHTDTMGPSAEKAYFLALQKLGMEWPGDGSLDRFHSGSFVCVNAWRNISETPVQNNHLACCDETSFIKPDDYIPSDNFGLGGFHNQIYSLSARHCERHRWYYFPQMRKSEILLFKQWDSDYTKSGRVCFHTAFRDPSAPHTAPA
jgi:hypothetical protein